jgi:hypothetical protein
MRMHLHGKITEVMSRARGDVDFGPGREVETDRERPSCEIHNPDFRPGTGADGKPRKPSGLCSECAADALKRRRSHPTAYEPEILPDPRTLTFGFGQDTERVQRALDAHAEREANRPGHVVPGSVEERRALDLIQDRRDEERDADRRKSGRGGVFLFSRIENGDLIDYYDRRRSLKERPQLVKVGP